MLIFDLQTVKLTLEIKELGSDLKGFPFIDLDVALSNRRRAPVVGYVLEMQYTTFKIFVPFAFLSDIRCSRSPGYRIMLVSLQFIFIKHVVNEIPSARSLFTLKLTK